MNISRTTFYTAMLALCLLAAGCAELTTEYSATGGSGTAETTNSTHSADVASSTNPTVDSDSDATAGSDSTAASDFGGDRDILAPGAPAPKIRIAKWVNGEPVGAFEKGKVYVVEFWATWCGPCLQSMPHMAKLQEEYGDAVTFIGISDESEATVAAFMEQNSHLGKKWSEVLSYRIALDEAGSTNDAFMRAARQGSIPCAFVVGKTGLVEWIGHPVIGDPLTMTDVLRRVVDDTWDTASARKSFVDENKLRIVLEEAQPRLQTAMESGDFATAEKLCDELVEQFPEKNQIRLVRLQVLTQAGLIARWNELAPGDVDRNMDDSTALNQIAWMIADGSDSEERNLDIAMIAARRAAELTDDKDGAILDTVARVYFEMGNLKEAISWQKKAVKAEPNGRGLSETLRAYEARAAESETKEKPATEEDTKN